MIVKTRIEIMRQELKTLALMKPEFKVINCERPIDIELEGDSDKPELIILNGTVTEADYQLAKELIPNSGIIAFTRGNAKGFNTVKEAEEVTGDIYKIVSKGGYFASIDTLLVYVKGIESEGGTADWKEYKRRKIPKLLMHNFKAVYKAYRELSGYENTTIDTKGGDVTTLDDIVDKVTEKIEEEVEKPKKRKRRTKAEIEADKAKENDNTESEG